MTLRLTSKQIDLLFLLFFLTLGSLYAYSTKDLFIGRTVFTYSIFILVPAAYLSLREKKNWTKIIIGALVFGGLYGFLFDFVAEYNRSWTTVSLLFPKVLGVAPIDNVLSYMFMTAFTVIFYQHFIEKAKTRINTRIRYALILGGVLLGMLILTYFFNSSSLNWPYPYLILGLLAIFVPVLIFASHIEWLKDALLIEVYFFFLYLIIEFWALTNNQWVFAGNNYIGTVNLAGRIFPFEELFIWMICYVPSIIAYYKFFVDSPEK